MSRRIAQRIVKVGTGLGVIIPQEIVRALKFQSGDSITVAVFSEDTIVMRKLSQRDIDGLRPQTILVQ